jgi:NAD-dependent deacetylase
LVKNKKIKEAAELIRNAEYGIAFTGAGISVDSGIPPFRGENGLWNKINPIYFEIEFFKKKPLQSWNKIKEIFYDVLANAEPNISHKVLSKMGKKGYIQSIITQNIDYLHQEAGCKKVLELHGTYKRLICLNCSTEFDFGVVDFNYLPPNCLICGGILKPEMVFFNEPIPAKTMEQSFDAAEKADVFLIIGANAEVYPANSIPWIAKEHGAKIIEINIVETHFTETITDIFLKGEASKIMKSMGGLLYLCE